MAAKQNNKLMCRLTAVVIFFCLVCCKSSAARLLNDRNRSNVAATDTAFDALVQVRENIGGASIAHDRPCEMEMMKSQRTDQRTGKLGGIYGSLVMNMLPKGRTPPSGPSRRNNDINI